MLPTDATHSGLQEPTNQKLVGTLGLERTKKQVDEFPGLELGSLPARVRSGMKAESSHQRMCQVEIIRQQTTSRPHA